MSNPMLTSTQLAALSELLQRGGAISANRWVTQRGRWHHRRKIPPHARLFRRLEGEYLPTKETPEHVQAVFTEHPDVRTVIGIINIGAVEALLATRKEIA